VTFEQHRILKPIACSLTLERFADRDVAHQADSQRKPSRRSCAAARSSMDVPFSGASRPTQVSVNDPDVREREAPQTPADRRPAVRR